jgi:indole-3-glycerol phosphate synthase
LQVLVELHDSTHLEWLDLEVISILGVNNRNLRTFEVNIRHAIDVLSRIPDHIVRVAESGIRTAEDLALIGDHGIDAALIGEAFMSAARPGDRLQALRDEYLRLLETD